jgi:hypothetical protein
MAAKISEYTLMMYGVDKLSAPAHEASKATAELTRQTKALAETQTFAQKIRQELLNKRAEGETAVDRVFSGNGEKALDILLKLGPEVAITTFAFDRLGAAAEVASEHIKKVRDNTEGVAEALFNVAKGIPIFGTVVAAGEKAGHLIRTMVGLEDPDDVLRVAQERDKRIAGRASMVYAGRDRDRLLSLGAFDRQREEINQNYRNLLSLNDEKHRAAVQEARDEAEKAHKELFDIEWNLKNVPGWARHHASEMKRLPQLRAEAGADIESNMRSYGRPYEDEAARLKREKQEERLTPWTSNRARPFEAQMRTEVERQRVIEDSERKIAAPAPRSTPRRST